MIGALRTGRKLGQRRGRTQRRNTAIALMLRMESELFVRRVAAREAAAELGEVLYAAPATDAARFLERLVTYLLQINEAFVQAGRDEKRRVEIAARLGLADDALTWQDLNDIAQRLLYVGDPALVTELVAVLREEVDWTIANAASSRG